MRFTRTEILIYLLFTVFIFGCSVQNVPKPEPVQEEKVVKAVEPESIPTQTFPREMVEEYARIHEISDMKEAEHRLADPEYAKKNPYTPTEADITFYERDFLERMYPGFKKMAEKEGFMAARNIYMRNPPAGPGSRRVGSTRYGSTMVRIGASGGRGASTGNVNTLFEEDPATTYYKEAMLLRRQGKPDEALDYMEKAVKAKPDSPSFLYTLGIMYMEKQEYSKAIEAMKRSIRHIKSTGYTKVNLAMYSDAYMGALTNLGLIYTRVGLYQPAIASLKEALHFRSGDLDANYNLVNVYYVMDDMEKATEQLRVFLDLDPENAEAHNIAGLVHYRRGFFTAAVREFKTAEELRPSDKQYSHNLGLALAELNRNEEASQAFRRATGLEEGADMRRNFIEQTAANNVRTLYNDGHAAMESRNWRKAIEQFKAVLELKPNMMEAHMNLGFSYRMKGDLDNQIYHFTEAARLNPALPDIHHNLGLAYSDARRYTEAADEFRKAIELDPSLKDSHFSLGMALSRTGKYSDAAIQFEKSLELSPDWFEAHMNLGSSYLKLGKLDNALKSFEKAAQLKPRSAEAQYNIGAAYMNMEKVDQAIAFFKKALEIYPGHTMARTLLKELESYQSE